MTKKVNALPFHATLYALGGAARLRILNLLRSVDPFGDGGKRVI